MGFGLTVSTFFLIGLLKFSRKELGPKKVPSPLKIQISRFNTLFTVDFGSELPRSKFTFWCPSLATGPGSLVAISVGFRIYVASCLEAVLPVLVSGLPGRSMQFPEAKLTLHSSQGSAEDAGFDDTESLKGWLIGHIMT